MKVSGLRFTRNQCNLWRYPGASSSSSGGGSPASVTVVSSLEMLVVDLLSASTSAAPIAAGAGQSLRWAELSVEAMSDKDASSPNTIMTYTLAGGSYPGSWWMIAGVLVPQRVIPEYPLGLPLLAIFMIITYELIKRRARNPKNI